MIGRILDGLVAIVGATGFAQFPAFYQQYLQRLGGRLDQARQDVARTLADATAEGKTLEAYIRDLGESGSAAAAQAAQRELERVDNLNALQSAYAALSDAEVWQRPLVFTQHFRPGVAEDAMEAFQPAFPVSLEGLVYAAVGMILGLILLAGCDHGCRKVVHRFREGHWG